MRVETHLKIMTANNLSAVQESAINDLGATVVTIAIGSQGVSLVSTWFALMQGNSRTIVYHFGFFFLGLHVFKTAATGRMLCMINA